jgi:hypothetical protein
MPDGFPEAASAWTGGLIPRWNFALALTGREIANTSVDFDALAKAGKSAGLSASDALLEFLFGCRADDPALALLRCCQAMHTRTAEFGALALASPEFQWR